MDSELLHHPCRINLPHVDHACRRGVIYLSLHHPCRLRMLLLAAVMMIYVSLKLLRRCRRRRENAGGTDAAPALPPGPWRLPVIGSLHHLAMRPRVVMHRVLADLARRCDATDVMYLRLGEVHAVVASVK
ncbi:hypothetical protein GUJ93_ZPchr0001g31241 [Zizania palustris]|uniref:Uncharacterized protein n=1 Tax=Zizania palustris TaxID=103762 RepID=A0A8J5RTE0_ZIZPA|nr:hypothetical protein GUJ93_ZPchr0001g31241 [Zizania palustris]